MQRINLLLIILFCVIRLSAQTAEVPVDSLDLMVEQYPAPDRARVDALNELGYRYWIVNSKKSILLSAEALSLAERLDYPEGIARAKRVLGVAYWTLGQPKRALENLTECQKNYEDMNDPEGAANCLMNSGMVYADIGDLDKALDIYERSIQLFTEMGLKSRIATTFNKIGSVLIQKGKLTTAKEYLTNALSMHADTQYVYGMAEAHNLLGKLFILENEPEQAEYHLKKAVELGEQVNDEDGLIGNLIQYGKLQRLQGRYESSEEYLKEALEKAAQHTRRKYTLDAYQELKLLMREQGRLEESLAYYDAFIALRDSIYNMEKSKQIAALEFSNELERKQQEILLLREQERTSSIISWSIGAGALALGIIAFLIVMNQRQRRTRMQEIYRKRQELLKTNEALAQTALENAQLKQKDMEQQLEFRNKELTSYTLNFVQKNELLQQLQDKIEQARKAPAEKQSRLLGELQKDVRQHVNIDRDWQHFKRYFEEVHTSFHSDLKQRHPNLSTNDLRICSLTRLNLNIKETASVLGISPESAKMARYRLRKKLNLCPEQELLDYFLEIEQKG